MMANSEIEQVESEISIFFKLLNIYPQLKKIFPS